MSRRARTSSKLRQAVMPIALLIAALATGVSPSALAQAGAPMVSPSVDARVAEARKSGYWVVDEGEYPYRIVRHFTADDEEARLLAKELESLNTPALMPGDPSRFVVGARVRLPERLVIRPVSPGSGEQPVAVPGRQSPAAGVADTRPGAAAAPGYVDRLIDGARGDEPELTLEGRPRDESAGLRSWAAELRVDHRDVTGSGTSGAQGIGLRYAQETEQYGNFALVGLASIYQAPPGDPVPERKRLDMTLFHDEFALSTDYIAASAIGIVRPVFQPWLASSYRVTLAPSLLAGASTTVTGAGGDFRMALGRLGRYSGFGIQQFERTSGEQASISGSQRVFGRWTAGGAAISVRNSADVPDHTSGLVALMKEGDRPGTATKLVAAVSDNGDMAGWIDAQAREGRLFQRYGAYQVDPQFRFGEASTTRDVRGAYWRGDYRVAGNYYGGGVELAQDNLRRDPARGGSDSAGVFGNLALRLDRSTQIGGGLSVRSERPRVSSGVERLLSQANAFVSRNWTPGQSRLDWNSTRTHPATGYTERTNAMNWNQDWPRLGPFDVSTLIGYSDERLADRHIRRKTASITTRGVVAGGVRLDASLTFVDVDEAAGGTRDYNASVGLDWNPDPDWTLALTWYRNRVQPGPDNPLAPYLRENTVQLTARYEGSAGSPYPRIGDGAARSGTGTIAGSVFFDDNGDGARQANERGAPNVTVILDERRSATTDPEGRFTIALVPAGSHRVRVLIERLPLPWGLEDESPRDVAVDIRSAARIDIGLTRIGP